MKNNKGFMLAEVVVTSTIVLTALISLYVTFNKLYSKYETNARYFDIDGVYAIKAMMGSMLESGTLNETIGTNKVLVSNGTCKISTDKCATITDLYSIKNMYIVPKGNLSIIKNLVTRKTWEDYITYMGNHYNISDTSYSYFIVVEYTNNDKYYYSSLKLG